MSTKTGIQWTDATWNPVRGCSRVSEGCRKCYAERTAGRFAGDGKPFHGFVQIGKNGNAGPQWTGKVELVEKHLLDPLKWRGPKRIFVNSMSDLFHENRPDEDIARVFAVMALCHWHTFQVLTKRAEILCDLMSSAPFREMVQANIDFIAMELTDSLNRRTDDLRATAPDVVGGNGDDDEVLWPLPNVWLGVSCEDQKSADERIPLLLQTPAAMRFVSYEPALGPVTFDGPYVESLHALGCGDSDHYHQGDCGGLDWIIVGGESGPGARPFNIAWARQTVKQCADAGVVCFVKQLGAKPWDSEWLPRDEHPRWLKLKDRKGGDMSEWPEDLRVRQFPEVRQ